MGWTWTWHHSTLHAPLNWLASRHTTSPQLIVQLHLTVELHLTVQLHHTLHSFTAGGQVGRQTGRQAGKEAFRMYSPYPCKLKVLFVVMKQEVCGHSQLMLQRAHTLWEEEHTPFSFPRERPRYFLIQVNTDTQNCHSGSMWEEVSPLVVPCGLRPKGEYLFRSDVMLIIKYIGAFLWSIWCYVSSS